MQYIHYKTLLSTHFHRYIHRAHRKYRVDILWNTLAGHSERLRTCSGAYDLWLDCSYILKLLYTLREDNHLGEHSHRK